MLSADYRLAKAMMQNRLEEAGSLAEFRQESWLSEMGRRLALKSAHLLVATGARLVSYGLPPYYPATGRVNGSVDGA